MRFIPTYVHGVIDYLAGVLLIASPWLFGFYEGGLESWLPIGAGVAMLVASLFTDYELGLVRQIPMSVHLGLDVALGLLLAISPWLFQFYETVWVPHLILGLAEIGGALTTQTKPTTSRTGPLFGKKRAA